MNEMGLAQAMGQGQGGGMGQGKLQEIVAMLMQGTTPEELLQMGVPEQLIMQAMEIVAEETAEVPAENAGLANMMIKPAR
jgi:hypothetical protein